jgi:Rrf2 family protein
MSGAFQISEAASLALYSMAIIAKNNKPISVKTLAEQTFASDNHLAKVMQRLVKGGLVKSARGPKGGFVLSKAPEDITLLDVYEAIEGKFELGPCPMDRNQCPFKKCMFEGTVGELNRLFFEFLRGHNLNYYSEGF